MEIVEIIKNDKLIARFMKANKRILEYATSVSGYNYYSSWDKLMPVVEKIEGLGFEVLIGRISCNINKVLDRENPIASFVCGDISKKREIVYSAIIEFLKSI